MKYYIYGGESKTMSVKNTFFVLHTKRIKLSRKKCSKTNVKNFYKYNNIIKVRDDSSPIAFRKTGSLEADKMFRIKTDSNTVWSPDGTFSVSDLRTRIEPWLTSLFQSEHLSLLIGSGLTTAIQYAACAGGNNGMGEFHPTSTYAAKIIARAKSSAAETGRGENPNFEDYIRVMCELLRGLEILEAKSEAIELKRELDIAIKEFTDNISLIENQIVSASEQKREDAFNKLVLFLMSFASRIGTRDRLNVFTTNYDRLIEAGADIAGIHLIDRFVGALSPVFRSSRLDIDMHYNPPGIRGEPRYLEGVVRYTKLHGSIDWLNVNHNIRRVSFPFGATDIQPYLDAPGLSADPSRIMIYPNSAKDRETAEYPYVELFRDFAAAICRPNSVLVTYGYSFGDEHINRVIRDMLTIPSTHLVIIAFEDSMGRISKSYSEWGHSNQISLIIGPDIANIDALVDYYLPKPSIDRATIRMTDLLRQRYDQPQIIKNTVNGGTQSNVNTTF